MFKVYVQCDKFSFQNERGFLVVAEEGEFFFVHQVVPEDTQRKQKKTSRSKQGKYVRISGAVWHYDDIICYKMQIIFVSKTLGKLLADWPN